MEEVSVQNITDRERKNSSEGNKKSMMAHFRKFYKVYLTKPDIPPPQPRACLTLENIESNEVTHDLLGSFAGYLTTATCLGGGKNKKNTQLLSYTSAAGHFCALKMYLKHKFMHEKEDIRFIRDENSKIYTIQLRQVKTAQSVANDKPLFGEYATASAGDRRAITALAFWNGCLKNTEFALLFQSCITNCSRGSEVNTNIMILEYLLIVIF